jgi:alpha,alpha-trehalose phosphorylase
VTITGEEACYELVEGKPIQIAHHGERIVLASKPVRRGIPPAPSRPRPKQPPGREPARRSMYSAPVEGVTHPPDREMP